MKILRLELYQQTACYKKPFAFKVSETYPLPPYATVKGMLHYLLDAKSFIPMEISIQGYYDTLATDYQTHYFFKKMQTNEFILTADGLHVERNLQDITSMPVYTHMLYDVHLIIHVKAEWDIMDTIMNKVNYGAKTLSLGRHEDLLRFDKCEYVEIGQLADYDEDVTLTKNIYIPVTTLGLDNLPSHYLYKLNSYYELKKGVRIWKKIETAYVPIGEELDADFVTFDNYGDLVFLADINGEAS